MCNALGRCHSHSYSWMGLSRLVDSVDRPEQGRGCGRPGAKGCGGDCCRSQDNRLV